MALDDDPLSVSLRQAKGDLGDKSFGDGSGTLQNTSLY